MLGVSVGVRILLSTEPADMRKGPDGLCALVKRQFPESVFSGTLFVFLSARPRDDRCGRAYRIDFTFDDPFVLLTLFLAQRLEHVVFEQ